MIVNCHNTLMVRDDRLFYRDSPLEILTSVGRPQIIFKPADGSVTIRRGGKE